MKDISTFALAIIISFALFSCSSEAKYQSEKKERSSNITITDAWARPAAEGAISAVYLKIHNNTETIDTLLNITTKAARMASIHQSYRNENGMTGMRPQGIIIIQPHSKFRLKPGGYHIMLMNLNQQLATGDSVQIVFNFAVSGVKKIFVPVQGLEKM